MVSAAHRFDGAGYDPGRDNARLDGQLGRVFNLMKDEAWRTLRAVALATGDPESSVSAQMRHLRKEKFGSHTVNRRHVQNGLFEYQLIVNPGAPPFELVSPDSPN